MKFFIVVSVCVALTQTFAQTVPSDNLVNAIIRTESNGDDSAVGDSGRAVGCMQIWKCVVDDVNEVSGSGYSYEDRLDRAKSIEIFRLYMKRYATKRRLGREPTDEDMARIWNGGPDGFRKLSTVKYWRKVRKYL